MDKFQTGNCWRTRAALSGAFGSAISGRHSPLFRRLVNSRKLKAITHYQLRLGQRDGLAADQENQGVA